VKRVRSGIMRYDFHSCTRMVRRTLDNLILHNFERSTSRDRHGFRRIRGKSKSNYPEIASSLLSRVSVTACPLEDEDEDAGGSTKK
jgi:hypothetical protein